MEFKVVDIKIKFKRGKNISLSDAGKLINLTGPLWQQGGGGPKKTTPAAAFILKKELPDKCKAAMKVTIHISGAIPGKYILTGSCNSEGNCSRSFEFSGPVEIPADKKGKDIEKDVDIFANNEPDEFFSISGHWTWKITANNPKEYFEGNTTYLELYWLYGEVDYSIFRKGVPLEILRHIAAAYYGSMQLQNRDQTPGAQQELAGLENSNLKIPGIKMKVIEAVVNWCFYRNPPRYDIYLGDPHFIPYGPLDFDVLTFLLYDYLKSIHDPNALCNCYDMAAVLQIYLMAIGIKVSYCEIKFNGILKLTILIGRGFCNNPFYDDSTGHPVVLGKWKMGRSFQNHAFCCLDYNKNNMNSGRAIDACVGPHIGDENVAEYLRHIGAKEDTAPVCKNGVSYINWIQQVKESNESIVTNFLTNIVGNKELNRTLEKYVLTWWPDPRACPVLGSDWEVPIDETIAGFNRAMRSWKLRRKGESININIFVSTLEKVKDSLDLFTAVTFIPTSSSREIIVTEPPCLGKFATKRYRGNFSRYTWTLDNVVFDVSFKNVTFYEEALLVWLNQLTYSSRIKKKDTKGYLEVRDKTQNTIKLAVGVRETFAINKGKEKLLIDFYIKSNIKGGGLQLIREMEKPYYDWLELEFLALKPSENILYLTAVDKHTLLSETIEYKIIVN